MMQAMDDSPPGKASSTMGSRTVFADASSSSSTMPASIAQGTLVTGASSCSSSSTAGVATSSLLTSVSGVWTALNAWGDHVEATHFNGDFLGTLSAAPSKAATKLHSSFVDGDFEAALSTRVDQVVDKLAETGQVVAEVGQEQLRRYSVQLPVAFNSVDNSPEVLQARISELQRDLAVVCASHESRAAEKARLSTALALLQEELAVAEDTLGDEPLNRLQEECDAANDASDEAFHEFDELQEAHHKLASRNSTLEAELRREAINADLAARADKQARTEGAWARDGPETEALKESKMVLAELLTHLDEARMLERRELNGAYRQMEEVQAEHTELLRVVESHAFAKSGRRGRFF